MSAARSARVALWFWVALAIVVWNGLYDLRITLGVRDYLLKQALFDAGRGPAVTISDAMHDTVRDAVRVASLWASIILLSGFWTVRTLGRQVNRTPAEPVN
jgi:hypothetical protein